MNPNAESQPRIEPIGDLEEFEKKNNYIDYFIRSKRLEEDLIDCLDRYGRPVSETERSMISKLPRSNASTRRLPTVFYYDDRSIELVHRREHLIVQAFGYPAPLLR